jgi:hypothetical protein
MRCGSRKTHVAHRRMKIERVYRPYLTATEAEVAPHNATLLLYQQIAKTSVCRFETLHIQTCVLVQRRALNSPLYTELLNCYTHRCRPA